MDVGVILFIVGLILALLLIGRGFRKGPKAPKWKQDKPVQQAPSGEGRGRRLDPLWRKPKQERKHDKTKDSPKRGNDGH